MSGGIIYAGVDFPEVLRRWIAFVASRSDRFWCETGAGNHRPCAESSVRYGDAGGLCGKQPELQLAAVRRR